MNTTFTIDGSGAGGMVTKTQPKGTRSPDRSDILAADETARAAGISSSSTVSQRSGRGAYLAVECEQSSLYPLHER